MKVTKKVDKSTAFKNIVVGETFLFDSEVYMKINTYKLINSNDINCVKLSNGSMGCLDLNTRVLPSSYQVVPLEE